MIPSSSSMASMTPKVPLTHRLSISFFMKMICAPTFIWSSIGVGREFFQLFLVYIVYRITSCSKSDGKVVILGFQFRTDTSVQFIDIVCLCRISSYAVENFDKNRISLSVYLFQFDAYQLHFTKHMGIKKEARRIKRSQQFTVILFNHRFQLVYVTNEQQLFSTKRFTHIAGVYPQYLINEIYNVSSDHTNLINNDKFHLPEHFPLGTIIFQRIFDMTCRILGIVGQ